MVDDMARAFFIPASLFAGIFQKEVQNAGDL
jgi:hypothetical protein